MAARGEHEFFPKTRDEVPRAVRAAQSRSGAEARGEVGALAEEHRLAREVGLVATQEAVHPVRHALLQGADPHRHERQTDALCFGRREAEGLVFRARIEHRPRAIINIDHLALGQPSPHVDPRREVGDRCRRGAEHVQFGAGQGGRDRLAPHAQHPVEAAMRLRREHETCRLRRIVACGHRGEKGRIEPVADHLASRERVGAGARGEVLARENRPRSMAEERADIALAHRLLEPKRIVHPVNGAGAGITQAVEVGGDVAHHDRIEALRPRGSLADVRDAKGVCPLVAAARPRERDDVPARRERSCQL